MSTTRYVLAQDAIPTHWYNLVADLPSGPPPPLHPGTGQPIGPDDLAPLFPMALIGQEVSEERWIPIPDPVREIYALWRPTPLHRARRWEAALGTDCRIFYKYEGVSPAGSHKPNTSVPRPGSTARRASPASRPRRAPASGARPSASPASSSASSARSTWCERPTTPSRTGAR